MSKVLLVPLQVALSIFACLSTNPILAEARLALGEETESFRLTSQPPSLLAQIIPDGTVNTQVNTNGNVAEITGGETRGSNLFHSFQDFSVPTGNEAFFNNTNDISNIFSRVTGGNISSIDGLIRANGSASLFLINPAGIIFGENARLDIGGSFYSSTGSSILFEDGEFSATDLENPPLLTINAPIGLNLRDNPGNIINQSVSDNVGLRVNSGETISFTGGEIIFDAGKASAPGGKVEILGNKVSLINNASVDVSSETGGGTVLIGGDYRGQDALINATRTYIDDSVTINADALINGNGGRVIVWGDEVTGFYGTISARGGDISGNGGFVEVSGKEHLIFRGNVDTTAVNGFTGTLLLDPTNIIIANGSGDSAADGTDTFTGNNSDEAGSILSTPLSEIDDTTPTTIFESELEGLSGDTNVILQATNDITIQDLADDELTFAAGSSVIAFTADADADGAGDFVMEDNTVVFDEETFVVNDADTIRTNGRNIALAGANLTLGNINTSVTPPNNEGEITQIATNSGSITLNATNGNVNLANLDSSGDSVVGGEITVNATGDITSVGGESLTISSSSNQADAGAISLNSSQGSINLTNFSLLSTSNGENGIAGDIDLTANSNISLTNTSMDARGIGITGNISIEALNGSNVELINDSDSTSTIFTGSATNVPGENTGGDIQIIGGDITIDNYNFNNTVTRQGNGGDILITGNSVNIQNLSRIDAFTFGEGDAGDVVISGDSVNITDGTSIATQAQGAEGNAGNIDIDVTNDGLFTLSGSQIISSSIEGGKVGDITINAGSIILNNNVEIEAGTFGSSVENTDIPAGNINLNANRDITINDSLIDSQVLVERNGANIEISASSVNIAAQTSITTETSGVGNAGSIAINVTNGGAFNLSDSSITTSTTGEGDAGNINVNAGSILITEGATISAEVAPESVDFSPEDLLDSELFLFDAQGNLLAENDDSDTSEGAEGSFSPTNSLIEYTFAEDGTYVIGVGAFDSFAEEGEIRGNTIAQGENYTLQVSVENQSTNTGVDGLVTKIEPNNSLDTAQNINNSFSNNLNSNIQNSTSIPHVSISAEGDGTFDYYAFDATTGSLGIFDIDQISTDNTVVQPGDIQAGNINLNATGDITISDNSSVSASTTGRGLGGSVNITTPNLLTIRDNSTVRVDSEGLATGGTLFIDSGSLTLENNGQISATTTSGKGGSIDINVDNILSMQDNSTISTRAEGTGNGGNIEIDAKFLIAYPNGNNDIIANAQQGMGGNININAESLFGIRERPLSDSTNDINASSEFSLDGTVNINTPDINPLQGATELPTNIVEPEQTTAQACQANREVAAQNGLNITGKGGIPPAPDLPLDSHHISVNGQSNTRFSVPEPIETSQGKIQPARGIKVTESGEIILTAYRTNNRGERIPDRSINCGQI